MKGLIKNIKNGKGSKGFFIDSFFPMVLVLLLIIPILDLLHPGLPITHDGQDHVARIANFYQNLLEGNFIPRWGANLNWGYGHPILMFLYPLPSYMTSLFHAFGFSFVDSIKIVFGVSFILSGLAMYLWLRAFLPLPAAVFGSLLYTYAPYRFVDLYVRGAIGEHVAFIFPPLVLYFLFQLSKKQSYWNILGGSLSLTCLILAHNAISLMFLPVIFFYIIFLIYHVTNKLQLVYQYTSILVIGFGLSAFFWVPAFLEGKYTLRDIVIQGEALNRFVPFSALLYSPWSYGITGQLTVQVGILHWVMITLSLLVTFSLFKKKNRNWILVVVFLFAFFVTIFLMTSAAKPVWEIITLLQKFQFPWRLLSLSVFFSAVLGAIVLSVFSLRMQRFLLVILIAIVFILNQDYWHAKDYLSKPEDFFTGIYESTTDTGESAPIWSVRFMEKRPKAHIEVAEGNAIIQETTRKGTMHEYKITALEKTKFVENTLYFPGWKVFVDGLAVPVEFQNPAHRGLMTFFVDEGKHTVRIEFEGTKLRFFANTVSVTSLLILIFLGIFLRKKLWQN